jgi:hypothetical protein
MPAKVYWGSPRQTQLDPKETLPAKLDLILESLNVRERVKDHRVAIKMHLGGGVGYSMIHPVFTRKVVSAVTQGGGHPFVTDLPWSVASAHERGYTAETLGCPLYPSTGIDEKWFVTRECEYRNIKEFQIGGAIAEATFLIDFAHIKGHPHSGFGGAIKNLALGCMTGATRSAMHDTTHFDPYFFKDKCPDEATRVAIRDSCPFGAIVDDQEDPDGLHLHDYKCNQCMRCADVAPGVFAPQQSNVQAFLEMMAISAKFVLDSFEPGNATFISLATQQTPLCDCFGFTSMPVLPDAGIFGSDDIVAVEQAVIDMTAKTPIIEENLPGMMEIVRREGHPWTWIHGAWKDPYTLLARAEALGLGSRAYELVDVLPVTEPDFKQDTYVRAAM